MEAESEPGSGPGSEREPGPRSECGSGNSGAPYVVVELTEYERIIAGGAREVSYRVRVRDGWIRIGSYAGAQTSRLPSEPQVVWARRVRLTLAVGTEVERSVVTPSQNGQASTFDYLAGRAASQNKRVQRQVFMIDRSGSLTLMHPPPSNS
jgi:hypothetical protein